MKMKKKNIKEKSLGILMLKNFTSQEVFALIGMMPLLDKLYKLANKDWNYAMFILEEVKKEWIK